MNRVNSAQKARFFFMGINFYISEKIPTFASTQQLA
jgi:hypothetical protein